MKKLLFALLALVLLLPGCSKTESNRTEKPDNILVGYGFSSYCMFGADQAIIDDLFSQFNSLSFEKTTNELDLASTFNVDFYNNETCIKGFSTDKNGVFKLNGETQCYKISSGSFDYNHLKEIYNESQNKSKAEATKSSDIALQHQLSKNQLLTIVNNMMPTKEDPALYFSSSAYAYINAHKDSFDQLVAGGQNTVAIFVDILRNSTEFGLDKYIMAAACAEITGIGNNSSET